MHNIELVVNHYNSKEFIPLLDRSDIAFKIYNKSGSSLYDEIGTRSNVEEIIIDNVGREAFVYTKHIYENYDNLKDITIFIQDDFLHHQFNYSDFFNKLEENKQKPFYQFPCKYHEVNWRIFRDVENGIVKDVPVAGYELRIDKFAEQFGFNLPDKYTTETGAFLLISRDTIQRYDREKYKELMDWFLIDSFNHEILMEHAWVILFQ
jgi:hypothetical protein